MTVAFKPTDEIIHVGRRPKPVPEHVTAAIADALTTGKNVTSGALTEGEFREVRADFRRAEKNTPGLKCLVSRSEKGGKLYALVKVTQEASK